MRPRSEPIGVEGRHDPRPAATRQDLPLLDVLRLVASFVIVRHHMRGDHLLGVGFGLPLFLVIMFALASSSRTRESVGRCARRKGVYLSIPWLRWSAIYLALLAAADLLRGMPLATRYEPAMVFYGGHPSLWFLPFAALAIVPVMLLRKAAQGQAPGRALWAMCVAGAVATLAASAATNLPLPEMPVRAWLRAAPAVFWGVALGQTLRAASERERLERLASVAMAAVATWCASLPLDGSTAVAGPFAIAVCLACLGFAWRPVVPEPIRWLSGFTFGIYLVHPLVGKVLGTGWDVFSWPALLHAAATWWLAFLFVWSLRGASLSWHELSTRPVIARRPVGSEQATGWRRGAGIARLWSSSPRSPGS